MPKFKKPSRKKKTKRRKVSDDEFAFRSIIVSTILAGIFLIISLVLNGTEYFFDGILIHLIDEEIIQDIETIDITVNVNDYVDNAIKGMVIVFFFIFSLISVGNYKELSGKPVSLQKEGLLLLGLALVQTIRNLWVFLITLIGTLIVLLYFYLIQET